MASEILVNSDSGNGSMFSYTTFEVKGMDE